MKNKIAVMLLTAAIPMGYAHSSESTGLHPKPIRPSVTQGLPYPPESRAAGEEGVVLVKILVDESGSPIRVVLHKSSGFPRLDETALFAVQSWRFAPATRDGMPRAAWVIAPIRFELASKEDQDSPQR